MVKKACLGQDCFLEVVLLLEWVCWRKRLVAENKGWLGLGETGQADGDLDDDYPAPGPGSPALLQGFPVHRLVPSCSSAFTLSHPHPLACSIIFLWKSTLGQILSSFLISNSRTY